MTEKFKRGGILTALATLILALVASLFCGMAFEAQALTLTRYATVLSSNVYDGTLQVQCKVSKNTESSSYAYSLRYSAVRADFEGDSISDSVARIAIAQPAGDYATVKADVSDLSADTIYFVIQVDESSSSGQKTTYTAIREAKNCDLTDTDQAYFMDCGATNLYSFFDSSAASLTVNQSRTWQDFGKDPITGKSWGVVSNYAVAATTSDRTLYGSTLNSATERMTFRFELDDDATAYDVVMGFKDQSSARINSSGDIFVNGDYENVKGSYVGGYNASTVHLTDVKGVGNAEDGYFLQIDIDKNEVSVDLPLCNFISIRKKTAETAKFIGVANSELNVLDGTKVSELPAKFDVYTTAGKTQADVSYAKVSDSKLELGDKTYYETTADATVVYDGKEYGFDLTIHVWTKEDVWYFVDCAQKLPFSPSVGKYEWLKENKKTLLNTDALDKTAMGSKDWGCFGDEPTVYWGNVNSYSSIYEGTNFNITYSFPNLPKGYYTFEVGVTDPWGPRTTRIYINDEQVSYLSTKTLQKAQKSVTFYQETDGAPVYIKLSGTSDKPLVGWMAITSNSNPPQDDTPVTSQDKKGCGSAIYSSCGVMMLCAGALAIAFRRNKKKN